MIFNLQWVNLLVHHITVVQEFGCQPSCHRMLTLRRLDIGLLAGQLADEVDNFKKGSDYGQSRQ